MRLIVYARFDATSNPKAKEDFHDYTLRC